MLFLTIFTLISTYFFRQSNTSRNKKKIGFVKRPIAVLVTGAVILTVGFVVFSKNNQQEIIPGATVVESVKKTNTVNDSNLFLANSSGNLAKTNNKIENSVEYQGEGGGMEGIMENWDFVQGTNLINIHASDIVINRLRDEVITYAIQSGDTVSSIAGQFNVSVNTILWANGLTAKSLIRPGTELKILPVTGVEHVIKKAETLNGIALYYKADIDTIIEFNNLPADGKIVAGRSIIVPDGTKPVIVSTVASYSGSATSYGYNPSAPSVISTATDGGYFMYPTTGRNWGRLHGFNAVDIATPCGTQTYAAAEGTVIAAVYGGWNGGYGSYVKIRHPNGVITLYAHLSKVSINNGAYVAKGQVIGLVGTTGRSTGCHLHWEVRGMTNPLIKY